MQTVVTIYCLGNNDKKKAYAYVCGIPKCFLSAFGWIFRHRPPQMQGTNGACVCTDTVTKSPRTTVFK